MAYTPRARRYVSKGEINQTSNARKGQDYATFTVKGRPGEYHEYVTRSGKKRTVYVAPRTKTYGNSTTPGMP